MKCGVCGGGYSKISADLFGCSTARNKGTCDNRLNIRRDVLEATVLEGLRHHLMEPDLFRTFCEEFTRELNRLHAAEAGEADAWNAELGRIERRLARLVDAIADGVPARTLKDELLGLEARQDELKARLAAAPAAPKPLLHPNLAEIYRREISELNRALEDDGLKHEAADLIRSLVDAIVLTPENGELAIALHGELGAMLRLAQDGKKASRLSPEAMSQIKLVAGARNHRRPNSLMVAV